MKLHCKCDRFFTPCGACPTQAKSKDREYLFTFDVRAGKDENGATIWNREQLKATSMIEVSRISKRKIDDLRYITKSRV